MKPIPNLKSTLIIGNGFIGSAIKKQHPKVTTFSLHDADITGNILNEEDVKKVVKNKQVIIYAIAHPPTIFNKEKHQALSVQGIKNVLKYSTHKTRIVYISAQGITKAKYHPYFLSKKKAEKLIKESKKPFTILRPSIVEGEGNILLEKIKKLKWLHIIPDLKNNIQPINVHTLIKKIDLDKQLQIIVGPKKYTMSSYIEEIYGWGIKIPIMWFFKLNKNKPIGELVLDSKK
jgi:dTDP-4-dehydrorhamnose reductase